MNAGLVLVCFDRSHNSGKSVLVLTYFMDIDK